MKEILSILFPGNFVTKLCLSVIFVAIAIIEIFYLQLPTIHRMAIIIDVAIIEFF